MKHLLPFLFLTTAALAQDPAGPVVAAERAFAQQALDQNAKAAFLANMSDSAVVFDRGKPVLARPFWEKMPESPARLIWGPAFAKVTSSSDLGISTGPWTLEANGKRLAYGDFFTVWQRQPDGTYKFLTDIGVSHPDPKGPVPPQAVLQMKLTKGSKKLALPELLKLDRDFGQYLDKKGPEKAYAERLAHSPRFLREGQLPLVSNTTILNHVKTETAYRFTPLGGRMAASGGMGFVYGTYEGAQRGSYVRVWTQEGKEDWKLAAEVLTPEPQKKSE